MINNFSNVANETLKHCRVSLTGYKDCIPASSLLSLSEYKQKVTGLIFRGWHQNLLYYGFARFLFKTFKPSHWKLLWALIPKKATQTSTKRSSITTLETRHTNRWHHWRCWQSKHTSAKCTSRTLLGLCARSPSLIVLHSKWHRHHSKLICTSVWINSDHLYHAFRSPRRTLAGLYLSSTANTGYINFILS